MEHYLVQRVGHHSYLGVWLNESLTWDKHTETLTSPASIPLNLLKRLGEFFPPKIKSILYKIYIRPALEYATCVFSSHVTADKEQMLEDSSA